MIYLKYLILLINKPIYGYTLHHTLIFLMNPRRSLRRHSMKRWAGKFSIAHTRRFTYTYSYSYQ